MHKIRTFLIFLLLVVAAYGCASRKSAVKKYYVIDIPQNDHVTLADSLTTIDKYCEIVKVNVYPAYANRQIPVRRKSHEMEYFINNEWAVRPQEILTRLIEEFMRKQGVFKGASVRFWKIVPELQMETSIYNLEIFEDGNTFYAHLHVQFRLVRHESGALILEYSSNEYKKLKKRDLNLFASEISELYWQGLRNFSIKAMTYFADSEEE